MRAGGLAGALVAVEGIDGSGLSTHSRLLSERLKEFGLRAVYTKEPTDGPVGRVVRDMLSQPSPNPWLMALLFAADRLWHMHYDPSLPGVGVEGSLREGYIVVTDRYKYSSIAYQGAMGVPRDWLWQVNAAAREADVIIYIDVPVDIAMARIARRSRREAYEDPSLLAKIKIEFEEVLSEAARRGAVVLRFRGVDGGREKDVGELNEEILNGLLEVLRGTAKRT